MFTDKAGKISSCYRIFTLVYDILVERSCVDIFCQMFRYFLLIFFRLQNSDSDPQRIMKHKEQLDLEKKVSFDISKQTRIGNYFL